MPGKTPDGETRHIEAAVRQQIRDERSAAEQLALLDARPGESRKERARLIKMLEAS